MNHKGEIEHLLIKGDLTKAIDELLIGTNANGQTRLHNDLILQSARNSSNEEENRKGILPADDYRREKARITYAVQSYLGDYLPLANLHINNGVNEQLPIQNVSKRTDIFISYSHHAEDQPYFDEINRQLKSLKAYGLDVKVWDDTQMRTGDEWLAEITKALKATRVGVLLVSQNFLASDFITTKEIPALLDTVKNEGGKIMSVILRQTPIKLHPVLKNYQAANPPEKPLNILTEPEKDAVYAKLLEDILHFYGIT
jgi:Effector-associated domain 11/TIR domain